MGLKKTPVVRRSDDAWLFTNHVSTRALVRLPTGQQPKRGILLSISLAAFRDLQRAHAKLSQLCAKSDFVIAFARGGIPLLVHCLTRESERLCGSPYPSTDQQREHLQRKYHLLPGFDWSKKTPALLAKLMKAAGGKTVTLLDCSPTGRALAKLAKEVAAALNYAAPKPRTITIGGIVQRGKVNPNHLESLKARASKISECAPCRCEIARVRDLVSEDFPEILGYLLVRESIKPVWSPGAICIRCSRSKRSHIRSAIPFYSTLDDLLADPTVPRNDQVDVPDHRWRETAGEALYFVLRRRYETEREEFLHSSSNTDAERRVQKEGRLLGQWQSDLAIVNRKLGTKLGVPEQFQKRIQLERGILRGNIRPFISILFRPPNAIVTLYVRYGDMQGATQTDFSLPIPISRLLEVAVANEPLRRLIGPEYLAQYDGMMASVAEQADELEANWERVRQRLTSIPSDASDAVSSRRE